MKAFERWLGLALLAAVGLQLFFVLRIALMVVVAPESTTFQRSEMWQQWKDGAERPWQQHWVDYGQISDHLKRAVLTSEDDQFVEHGGVRWDAIERAMERNAKEEHRAARQQATRPARVFGGSTITQQLAKNLLLSGERNLLRKGQELVLAHTLELMLSKQRILEIYLNNVEWGNGIFGAEAAAQHYFGKSAARLAPAEAARLAVMLPNPRHFEANPRSPYLNQRSNAIQRRMAATPLP